MLTNTPKRQTPVRDKHAQQLIESAKMNKQKEQKRSFFRIISDTNEEFLDLFIPGRKDYRAAIASYGF